MEWLDWVIKIGGAITALGVIWAAVTIAVKAAIKKELSALNKDIEEMKEDNKKIKEHSLENYLSGLRLTIMSSDMPYGERIVAAYKYISAGGNGDVKKFAVNELHINDIQHD